MKKILIIIPVLMMFLMGCNSDLAQRVEDLEKREVLLEYCLDHITWGIDHRHQLLYPNNGIKRDADGYMILNNDGTPVVDKDPYQLEDLTQWQEVKFYC